jgi:creatinine amidohydrolase
MLGHMWVTQMLKKFPVGAPIYVAPPITYGKSNEHLGFPGTVSISGKTLRNLLLAIAGQLKTAGFRQMAILNSHGGNTSVLAYTVREIQSTLEMRAGILGQPYKPPLSPQEVEFGFHAGEWETSLMLWTASDLVHMDKAVSEYPLRGEAAGAVRLDGSPAYLSWMTADISESGVMGDAKAATAQKGERWAEAGAAALAQKLSNLEAR